MHVISRARLRDFWERHPDTQTPLASWYRTASKAAWRNLAEVRQSFNSADVVDQWTVFNIRGNRYRLIVRIDYVHQMIFIHDVLTHAEYDRGDWKHRS